ncbi:hypothetical protein ACFFF7_10410 [Novosphingobium aquiterrae]|uniref:Solute:sodium symporter small subunit n=1 Tax=Novosphingobium aquiterrae TaxID=624388 RepID=A0ABV6PJ20_9SPHN
MTDSPLDDADKAHFAWTRFRRMMRWWALVSALIAAAVIGWFWQQFGLVSIHFYIAAALGIGFMVMMTGALMSLLFLSSGTGHDEAVRDFERNDRS